MLRRFATFTLDTENQCIWAGEQRVQLPPKAYLVLSYLVENADRIVTKSELLKAAWPETFVGEGVLKTCILDVRKSLGDNQKEPQYIHTVHRRGYRFTGGAADFSAPPSPSRTPADTLAGRSAEMERLRSLWEVAAAGDRRVVFIAGEPGSGKTALIARFLRDFDGSGAARLISAQCREHFGPIEPYYAVLEALTAQAKDASVPGLLDTLRRYAPTWLVQMPGVLSGADRELLKEETLGATRDRMLREMSEAIEESARVHPLVLVIEDLHWSDLSTLDLVSAIANRKEAARLLLIISYRPVEAITSNHPVRSAKERMLVQARCEEIELQPLDKDAIREHIDQCFPGHRLPEQLSEVVHARTEGNPLFMANLLDYAVSRDWITRNEGEWRLGSSLAEFASCVPENLSKMILTQVDRLTAREQSILEAASVAGPIFASVVITGDRTSDALDVESCCDELARRELFIRSAGVMEFPSGAVSARYQFIHALYQDVFYHRMSPARRMRLHRTIAEQLERVSAGELPGVASELAVHFQGCRDYKQAILYLRLLAQQCAARHAHSEAIDALTKAHGLAERFLEPRRSEMQLDLIEQLGLVYRLMGHLSASSAEFLRMFEKARQTGNLAAQLRSQLSLASVLSWVDRDRCLRAASIAVEICDSQEVDSHLRMNVLGQAAYWNLLFLGWDGSGPTASAAALEAARQENDAGLLALHYTRHSFFEMLSSNYRIACSTAEEGVRIAINRESLADYSIGHYYEAFALLHLGEWGMLRHRLTSALEMARRNGHELWVLLFSLLEGFLEVHAFSFNSAREKCRNYLQRAHKLQHPLSIQISLVLLGLAELGAGNLLCARENFEKLRAWHERERILMDWIWKLPLQLGLAHLSLAEGDLESARNESRLSLSLASATAECTWTGLAHHACACVALASNDVSTAKLEVTRGLEAIDGREAPLAEWRLHSLAAEILDSRHHLRRARFIMTKLGDSLGPTDPLRRTFPASTGVSLTNSSPHFDN